MPLVRVLGIDDQRRGARRFHKDPASGAWVADTDCWQTVFIDTAGGHGLLGLVEGRRKAPAVAWILALPEQVRAGIEVVTMDLSPVYRAVAREALPHALVCADLFHVAQLANKMVDDVRRRNTHRLRGRRGRRGRPRIRGQEPAEVGTAHALPPGPPEDPRDARRARTDRRPGRERDPDRLDGEEPAPRPARARPVPHRPGDLPHRHRPRPVPVRRLRRDLRARSP
nr:transposase [Frankia sp. Cppng1_Ct_nod]